MNSYQKKVTAAIAILIAAGGAGIGISQAVQTDPTGPPRVPTIAIDLSPDSATNVIGDPHTVQAHNWQITPGNAHVDQPSKLVTFSVISGPNAGLQSALGGGTCNPADCKTDNVDGHSLVDWTYTSEAAGTDTIRACWSKPATPSTPFETVCDEATKTWVPGNGPSEQILLDTQPIG